MDVLQTISVPIIAAVVYCIMEAAKIAAKNETFNDYIPLLSLALGAVTGIAVFFGFPELIPAENVLAAAIIGAASGWAATGANQTFKKIQK
jgi:hypothetical protein